MRDNAELDRLMPVSKTITTIVVSFLFRTSYFTGIIILSYVSRRHSSKKTRNNILLT